MSIADFLMNEVHVLSKVEVRVKKPRSKEFTKSNVDERGITCIRIPSLNFS